MDNNRLIAEFMGLKVLTVKEFNSMPIHENLNVNEYSILEYQRYHTEWNWLMPVVEKINSLDTLDLDRESNYEFDRVLCLPVYTDIKTVYKKIVNFIEWYNLKNK